MADCSNVIRMGFSGENNAKRVSFDLTKILDQFGTGGRWILLNRRPGEFVSYPVPEDQIEINGGVLIWTVKAYDVEHEGRGECQLSYTLGNVVKMTIKYQTAVAASLVGDQTAPDPYETWLQQLAEYADAATAAAEEARDFKNGAEEAAERAEAATVQVPFVGENGNWYTYSQEAGQYIDTGISARPSFVVVSVLPAEGGEGVIYLVPNGGTGSNLYDEYVYISDRWEMIGTTEIDLSGYATKPVTSGQIASGAVTNDKIALTKINLGSNITYSGNKGIAAGGSTNAITYWTPESVAAVATFWRYNGNVFMSTHSNNSATPPEDVNLDSSFYSDWVPALLFSSTSGGGLFGNGAVTGSNSLSVGQGCAVLANQSAAIGARNAVTHSNVLAAGVGLLSGSGSQVLFGSWNVKTAGRMIVGAGSSDNRRNDLLLDANGNLHIRGKVYQEATNPDGTGGAEVGGATFHKHILTIHRDVFPDFIDLTVELVLRTNAQITTVSGLASALTGAISSTVRGECRLDDVPTLLWPNCIYSESGDIVLYGIRSNGDTLFPGGSVSLSAFGTPTITDTVTDI